MQLSPFGWCQLSWFLGIVGLCKSYSLQAEKYLLSWFGSCTAGLSIIMWQQIRLLISLRKRRTDGVSVSRWSRKVMDGWKGGSRWRIIPVIHLAVSANLWFTPISVLLSLQYGFSYIHVSCEKASYSLSLPPSCPSDSFLTSLTELLRDLVARFHKVKRLRPTSLLQRLTKEV